LQKAIGEIEAITHKYAIHCEFQKLDAYKYAETPEQLVTLENEIEIAKSLNLDVEMTKDLSLPFGISGAARFKQQAQFHALKYLYGLAEQISGDRSFLFEGTRVHKIDDDDSQCRLQTDRGEVVCKQVILATHTPIGRYISLHSRLAPYFSYALGVRLKNPPPRALYWDMSDPYFYLRQVGNEEKTWVVGGCDHKTGQEVNTFERYLSLEQFLRERFEVEEIEFYWGAEVFESVDGLPYVGKIPFTKNIYTATGYSGVGLTNATMSAGLLRDLIMDRENVLASIYDPARVKPWASMNRFTKENANVARRLFSDRMAAADTDAVNNIPSGEGRIVDKYGERIAVYKDGTNHLHAFSPVCPHMGCIVHWNKAEKTWDCPCHGSRFNPTGEVVNGPALENLERVFLDADQNYQRVNLKNAVPQGGLTTCTLCGLT
jgi:glycine/D-amino acid oxidase-like deaminating enzyme/nitrite reductase/ring-hydroxylating ferredoxin subunit